MAPKKEVDMDSLEFLTLKSGKNKYSNRVLDCEKINNPGCGFRKFMGVNRAVSVHWWQQKFDRIKQEMLPEQKVTTVENDPFNSMRCKRFLLGEECVSSCSFIHKFPREDKILCRITESHDHATCSYYHPQQIDKFKDSKASIKKVPMKVDQTSEHSINSPPADRLSSKDLKSPSLVGTVKAELESRKDSATLQSSISRSDPSSQKKLTET